MSKKLTIEFVKEQFRAEGYTLLSKEYVNSCTPLDYICPKGHKGTIVWGSFQRGCRCAECVGLKKLTIEFIKNEFKKENYILLTKEYKNSQTPLEYICPKKHNGTITWNNWSRGCRCLKCSGKKKHTLEFIREQFKEEDYILISTKYIGAHNNLDYICPKGHRGSICWHSWQRGRRCQKCSFENNCGKNNPNWNPNLTYEDRQDRRLIPDYKEWVYEIKKRDNFICQICGDNKGGDLVSHHLESYRSNLISRTALNNGVCLCEKCHKNFHYQYGYGDNTKEQFDEFFLFNGDNP